MWARLMDHLVCYRSAQPFELVPIEECEVNLDPIWRPRLEAAGIDPHGASRWIETGFLCDRRTRLWFPISQGLPILLPYQTAAHGEILRDHGDAISRLGEGFHAPADEPAPGERLVLKSYSTEWRDYVGRRGDAQLRPARDRSGIPGLRHADGSPAPVRDGTGRRRCARLARAVRG
jgi:uncharacterized protein YbaR (Trm112 family)